MRIKKLIKTISDMVPTFIIVYFLYFFQFTGNGYRVTVPYRPTFQKISDNIYVNKGNDMDSGEILELVQKAQERTERFYGELKCLDDTVMIICDDEDISEKIGDKETASTTFPKKKNYICISNENLNLDILSHEMTHAELHYRLKRKALLSLPVWFNEGVATQNDYREAYSDENWALETDNGKNTIDCKDMDTPDEFYAGTNFDKHKRYINAKHEVSRWLDVHGQQGLIKLIDELNNGEDFDIAYGK